MSPQSNSTAQWQDLAASMPRLVLDGISYSFADTIHGKAHVLENIGFAVRAGEFVALIGPSGCGKSTLLNIIAGLLTPEQGAILLDGDDGAPRLGRVAYMQQRDLLLPWRTVRDNARLGLEFRRVPRAIADEQVRERAERFGLASVLRSYPWQLSGGMRQRTALLRATLPESKVLLLDEPFGALDAITRRELQQWLADVLDRADKAVVLVTHDVEEALLLADRVHVMAADPGRIVASVEVDLLRPRGNEMTTSREFVCLKSHLLDELSRTRMAGRL
jgi:ABC-type nitrate/sulfonate/bicarbonate transport system ATPase subunit